MHSETGSAYSRCGDLEVLTGLPHHDHLLPEGCGQFDSWWLHQTPLQVEGVALQAHLQGAGPLPGGLRSPLARLQTAPHHKPEDVSDHGHYGNLEFFPVDGI